MAKHRASLHHAPKPQPNPSAKKCRCWLSLIHPTNKLPSTGWNAGKQSTQKLWSTFYPRMSWSAPCPAPPPPGRPFASISRTCPSLFDLPNKLRTRTTIPPECGVNLLPPNALRRKKRASYRGGLGFFQARRISRPIRKFAPVRAEAQPLIAHTCNHAAFCRTAIFETAQCAESGHAACGHTPPPLPAPHAAAPTKGLCRCSNGSAPRESAVLRPKPPTPSTDGRRARSSGTVLRTLPVLFVSPRKNLNIHPHAGVFPHC